MSPVSILRSLSDCSQNEPLTTGQVCDAFVIPPRDGIQGICVLRDLRWRLRYLHGRERRDREGNKQDDCINLWSVGEGRAQAGQPG